MFKDRIHIDQLFEQLKGYQHPTEGGFEQINDKLQDGAWQEKFSNYEHSVSDIPDFAALPMQRSDKSGGMSSAGKLTLLILALLTIGIASFVGYQTTQKSDKSINAINNNVNSPSKYNKVVEDNRGNNSNSRQEVMESTASEEILESNSNNIDFNAPAKNTSANHQKTTSNQIAKVNGKHIGESDINTNNGDHKEIPVGNSNLPQNLNAIDKYQGQEVSMGEPSEMGLINPISIYKPEKTLTISSLSKGINPFSTPLTLSINNNIFENPTLSELGGLINKASPLKFKPSLYGELGFGLLHSNAPFLGANNANSLTYHAHIGLSKGRLSAYSGLERNHYVYRTNLRKLQIYDSFPHLSPGPNPDTIGWFKKNIRDTTINEVNESKIVLMSIPLHFQFTALYFRKFTWQVGSGLNLNLISRKALWVKDNNDYLVNEADQNGKSSTFNLGLSFSSRFGYQLSPLTEIYAKISLTTSGNVLRNSPYDVRPGGTQLDLGLKYHLK